MNFSGESEWLREDFPSIRTDLEINSKEDNFQVLEIRKYNYSLLASAPYRTLLLPPHYTTKSGIIVHHQYHNHWYLCHLLKSQSLDESIFSAWNGQVLAAGVKREGNTWPLRYSHTDQHCLQPKTKPQRETAVPTRKGKWMCDRKKMHLFNTKKILYYNCLSHFSLLLVYDQLNSRNCILLLDKCLQACLSLNTKWNTKTVSCVDR